MLKFSELFEFSRENSHFERIRMVRMVRMVRSLADRTFQLWFYARPAAFLIFVVVGIFANAFHFAATGLQGYPFGDPTTKAYAFEPSVLVGTGAFYFVFAGPGKYAMREDGF